MVHAVITGGCGMLGQKLARLLLCSDLAETPQVTVIDRVTGPVIDRVSVLAADFTSSATASRIAMMQPDVIFHLAAVVSGEAENNFDLGWSVNFHAHHALLEALRSQHEMSGGRYRPRLSRIGFGGDHFLAAYNAL